MTFPFVIELEQKINITGDANSLLEAFNIIQAYLKSKSIDDYYKTGEKIKFKKGFFGMNTNVFAIIDKGEFELSENNREYKLIYRFYLLRFFITSLAMSIGFGLISRQFIAGIVAFFALCIGNFIVCGIRQQYVIDELAKKINKANNN